MTSRRVFLRSAALATVAASALPWRTARAATFHAALPGVDPALGPNDPVVRELAMQALDAARAAGATYADVRLTADRLQTVSASKGDAMGTIEESGTVYIGVRALVDGFWGFAAADDCTGPTAVRLAREAAAQAKSNTWGTTRSITMDAHPPTGTASWTTPITRDPFTVSADEKSDFLHGILELPELLGFENVSVGCKLTFRRQEKVFAATSGAYLTQTLFWTGPSDLQVSSVDPSSMDRQSISSPFIPLQSGGYECVTAPHAIDQLPRVVDEFGRQQFRIPISVGKYDLVLDAHTTAAVMRSTVGYASEFDRIQGDEVNSVGTSYLSEALLGTPIAAPSVTVTGNRSLRGGPAAVGWDEDGVAPHAFDIIKDGTLVDFATNRENAATLQTWYQQRGMPAVSHGCAAADNAADMPLVQPPDLTLHPSTTDITFDRLVADTRQGIAVLRGDCAMDSRLRTGQGWGTCYEIREGKLGRYLGPTAAFSFQSMTFLKSIVALGGPSSAELRGFTSSKGQPEQQALHGVFAVPTKVHDVIVLDLARG